MSVMSKTISLPASPVIETAGEANQKILHWNFFLCESGGADGD